MAHSSNIETSTAATPNPAWPLWPFFTDEMCAEVLRVLESGKVNYWTGEQGRNFETEFANYVGCQHAIAVANGTLALELALIAIGIEPGDEVIVPSRTFIATASSVVARGGVPACADVDPDSQTLTAATVEPLITNHTKAVIAVHLAGWPCDMDPLLELARQRGIAVIEDCAQAHGAAYKGRAVGSLGDIGAFSFCQDKIMTTAGEGGMLVTNRTDLWDKAWRYKDHGKPPSAYYEPQPPGSSFRWLHDSFGSNFRLTEVQSAVGRIALRLLPTWNDVRAWHAQRLADSCRYCPGLRVPLPVSHIRHGWYKFYAFVQQEQLARGWNRDRILQEIRTLGVPCYSGSCGEIYREQAFPDAWRPSARLPIARLLHESSIMFRVDPALNDGHIDQTAGAISQIMQRAAKAPTQAA